jgi:zinc transport system substrate-binding protein
MQRIPWAGLLWLTMLGTAAPAPAGGIRILTTSLPLYCLVCQLAGDAARVENLLAPGTDAHDFQLARRERERLERAEVIVVNGLGLEPWLPLALRASSAPGRVIVATAGLGRLPSGRTNLHVWLDPLLACRMVTNILEGLRQADPAQASRYAANAGALVTRLQSLDDEIRAALQPLRGAALVTQHDAFAHFALRYNLRVVGVLEEVPGLEPSPRHLSRVRRVIQEEHVRAIFVEPPSSSRLARQLAQDLGLAVAPLDPLETGAPRPEAYEEGMRRNVRTLRQYVAP